MLDIVIVNYRSYLDTIECLAGLIEGANILEFRVYIIDNSEDSSCFSQLTKWAFDNNQKDSRCSFTVINEADFNNVTYFESKYIFVKAERNDGFAAANNIVMRKLLEQSSSGWIWLLNNDTVVPMRSFRVLGKYINSILDSEVGILGGPLFNYHNKGTLQALGGAYNKYFGYTTHVAVGRNRSDLNQNWSRYVAQVDYVIGASMLVNKKFVRDVGLMNEDFFLYFEELDWAERGKRMHWKFSLIPDYIVYHKEGGSINKGVRKSELAEVCYLRNRLVFTRIYYPKYSLLAYSTIFLTIINRVIRFQFRRIPVLLMAAFSKRYYKKYINEFRRYT